MINVRRKNLRDFLGIGHIDQIRNNKFSKIKDIIPTQIGIQDPTYFSFNLFFDFINTQSDNLSSPRYTLLLDNNEIDSSINQLLRLNRASNAAALEKFISTLKETQEYQPWYFQKIAGLNELMKIPEPGETHREKDKFLTIETLETLDMKMNFLANLYKTAIYDMNYKRYLLPRNSLLFNMKIVVTEARDLTTLVYQQNKLKDSLQNNSTDMVENIIETVKTMDDSLNFKIFKLYGCKFIFNDFPSFGEISNSNDGLSNPALFSFQILPTNSFEISQYGYFEWILDEEMTIMSSNDTEFLNEMYKLTKYSDKKVDWHDFTHNSDILLSERLQNRALNNELASKKISSINTDVKNTINTSFDEVTKGSLIEYGLSEATDYIKSKYLSKTLNIINKQKLAANDFLNNVENLDLNSIDSIKKTYESAKKAVTTLKTTGEDLQTEFKKTAAMLSSESKKEIIIQNKIVDKISGNFQNSIYDDNGIKNMKLNEYYDYIKNKIIELNHQSSYFKDKIELEEFKKNKIKQIIETLEFNIPEYKNEIMEEILETNLKEMTIEKLEFLIVKPLMSINAEELISPNKKDTIDAEELISPNKKDTIDAEELISPNKKDTIEKEELISPKKKETIEKEELLVPKKKDTIEKEELSVPKKKDTIDAEEFDNLKIKDTIEKEEFNNLKIKDTIENEEFNNLKINDKIENLEFEKLNYIKNINNLLLDTFKPKMEIEELENLILENNKEIIDIDITRLPFKTNIDKEEFLKLLNKGEISNLSFETNTYLKNLDSIELSSPTYITKISQDDFLDDLVETKNKIE